MGSVSAGPVGQVGRLLWFILLCLILFIMGIVKGAIIGPLATLIFFCGIMAVVIGLWPVHVVVVYRTIAMTKRLGILLKILLMLLLPIPLLLWPMVAAVGSILAGLGYGIGQPLVATFEAVGESREKKFYHAFVDGTLSTFSGSFTVVRDFLDFSYHSVFDMLDDFRTGEPRSGKPAEIQLLELPLCAFIGALGVLVDPPAIGVVALCKAPIMLFKGWRRLLEDLLGRQGPCLEAACVPFAGLALVLWPFVVALSVLAAIICSPFLGLYGAVVVYQEMSVRCGLNYVVAIVAEFDEYSNDVLHMHEGSCLPRPRYRMNKGSSRVEVAAGKSDIENAQNASGKKDTPEIPQLNTQKSLRHTLQEVKLVQILDSMFKVMEINGKNLVKGGVLKHQDFEAAMKGNRSKDNIILVGLPTYCTFRTLLNSAKSNSSGILLRDGTELTTSNKPRDRITDWFFEPLLTIKEQLRAAKLQESEEHYLEMLCLMIGNTERMTSWDNGGVEPEDGVRKGEMQALARRLQGIATSVSRMPTHRRRMEAFLKAMTAYTEEVSGSSSRQKDPRAKSKSTKKAKSFNFRSFSKKEGSDRLGSTKDPVTEREGSTIEITPNADEAV